MRECVCVDDQPARVIKEVLDAATSGHCRHSRT